MNPVTELEQAAPAVVLACGAYLKNRAGLLQGRALHWSPPHGDLGQAQACAALEASVESLLAQALAPVQAVAHDLHPDFFSTRLALRLAQRLGVPAIAVQHHHAHSAAVQAEWGLSGPVIGIALDGFVLGDDGGAWGGELLWADGATAAWRRVGQLAPLALPGGDRAAREPWRLVAALQHALGRTDQIRARWAPRVGDEAARIVQTMLARDLNCPLSSSAGRWFDAAAAALGLCEHQQTEAQAAIELEQVASDWLQAHPGFDFPWESLDLRPVLAGLLDLDRGDAEAVARGAAVGHLALAHGLAQAAARAAAETASGDSVLGGGCFANRVLSLHLGAALRQRGLRVHAPRRVDRGDAGLALGQAWVAARQLAPCAGNPSAAARSFTEPVH
ncbi:MAG: carbamoyltransferase HypF [Burkholderiaceae bacterium]|nr:carbamoyltransferase HypF [Burkholderiaceae bacterium]